MTDRNDFLSGVLEGFYGQPWSAAQRQTLFGWMAVWGLSVYMYAPKDDLKHRALWREPYSDTEMAVLSGLIRDCRQRGLKFLYGLSPGLDVRYSEGEERARIKRRFTQLLQAGVEHFALLFDDIPPQLPEADRARFDSFAAAQSSVANELFHWLRQQRPQGRFLFCPTAYCDRMAGQQLGGADYLETLGQLLDPAIDVFWTGPEIVSREIPPESIRRLASKVRRPPVIWDNLHANDYDLRRLYCGPYSGRPPALRGLVRGILANPNNEFPANFIPLRTLARYVQTGDQWDARQAYLESAAAWLEHFASVGESISLEDLILLGDCFYLPHEEGIEASRLYTDIRRLVLEPPNRWGDAASAFRTARRRVQVLFERLTELRDRDLFYAFGRRIWELNEELSLIAQFLCWKEQNPAAEGFVTDSHLPGTYRGGLAARLQRLIRQDDQGRFWPQEP